MNSGFEYDELCKIIYQCITETAYKNISECKSLLMVAINEEARMKKCMDRLLQGNPELRIIFISQPYMEPILKEWYGEKYQIIGWKGRYTPDILHVLEKEIELPLLDGFLYFTEMPVNMRDENFTQIAEMLQDMAKIRIFSNTIGEDLYEYHDLALYNQAIRVHTEINRLIELVPDREVNSR